MRKMTPFFFNTSLMDIDLFKFDSTVTSEGKNTDVSGMKNRV